jgi:hypothetical protein
VPRGLHGRERTTDRPTERKKERKRRTRRKNDRKKEEKEQTNERTRWDQVLDHRFHHVARARGEWVGDRASFLIMEVALFPMEEWLSELKLKWKWKWKLRNRFLTLK